jgi:branched-chain amino acid transport system permease protein
MRALPRLATWVAVALIAGLLLGAPVLLNTFFLRVLGEALVFGLLATSINILVGYAGLATLGQAGIFGVASYGVGYLMVKSGQPLWVVLPAALLAALVVTIVFGLMAVRTSGIYFLMITLAQGMIIWGLAFRWVSVTGAENGIRGIRRPDLIGPYARFYYLILLAAVIILLAVHKFVNSSLGLTLKGIREREGRMATLGYRVSLHKFLGFLGAGLVAALAGLLYVFHNEFVSPAAVEFAFSAESLLMVILGGAGTLYGPMLGSLVVTFTRHEVSLFTDRWLMILGAIYVVTILVAPDGLVGGFRRLARRISGAAPGLAEAPAAEGLRLAGEEEVFAPAASAEAGARQSR